VSPGQFLVVADPVQLAALQQLGVATTQAVEAEDMEMAEDASSDGSTVPL
jgi:hypothetical protein